MLRSSGILCSGSGHIDPWIPRFERIDWPLTMLRGALRRLSAALAVAITISRPVLQRLVDGRTLGLAIRPLGAVVASFHAASGGDGAGEPRLLFDVRD